MKSNFKLYLVLIILFALSLYVRKPLINNKVDCINNCFLETLTILDNMKTYSQSETYFSPIQTYNNSGDKFVDYYIRVLDAKGNNYYVSFPPFTYLFTIAIIKTFNLIPTKLLLQIISLLLHFFSAVIIYYLINLINSKRLSSFQIPALFGFVAYMFSPIMLYFSVDIYSVITISRFLFILSIFLSAKYFIKPHKFSTYNFIALLITMVLLIYSEWIGVFFALTMLFLLFVKRKESDFNIKFFAIISIAIFLTLAIIFVQYSSISGINNYIHNAVIRFTERSGFFPQKYSDSGINLFSIESYLLFFENINKMMVGFGYFTILLYILALRNKLVRLNFNLKNDNNIVLFLIIIPIVLHFIIFFNANAIHKECHSIIIVLISLLLGLTADRIFDKYNFGLIRNVIIIIVGLIVMYSLYFYNNNYVYKSSEDSKLVNIANIIKGNSKHDEAIFVSIKSDCPFVIMFLKYYSKRNIAEVNDKNKIILLTKKYKLKKAVYFQIEDITNNKLIIEHFSLKQQ